MLVLPADHLIDDQGAFAAAVKQACRPGGAGQAGDFRHCSRRAGNRVWLHRGRWPRRQALRGKTLLRSRPWNTSIQAVTCGIPACSASRQEPCWSSSSFMPLPFTNMPWLAGRQRAIKTQGNTPMMEIDPDTFAAIPGKLHRLCGNGKIGRGRGGSRQLSAGAILVRGTPSATSAFRTKRATASSARRCWSMWATATSRAMAAWSPRSAWITC